MPLPIVGGLLGTIAGSAIGRKLAPKILPDSVEKAIYGTAGAGTGAVIGAAGAGALGGLAVEPVLDAAGNIIGYRERKRRRRRRLLTASDKQDIAALRGILGDSAAFRNAVGGLLSKRM